MRIALICPSNMLYMPYVENYEIILKENNLDYDIINWDRFNMEDENNPFKYKDKKIGHRRNFFDYYKYKKFIIKHLNMVKYDKVIVFGIQITFFLKKILQKKFTGNYIIDIRDYNPIINYFNISKVINNSSFTVLSSPGYKEWLPNTDKYIINHNTKMKSLDELKSPELPFNKEKINIAYIGAIRDYQVNIDFIDSLKNSNLVDIFFHGEGNINKDIKKYLDSNNIQNVYLTGRYEKKDERKLYDNNDFINVLRYNERINNKTALPNRLYNAAIYGKPMIAFTGNYLAKIIADYELGLILDSFNDTEDKIKNYLKDFDKKEYEEKRHVFFEKVIEDNKNFNFMLFGEFGEF